MSSGVFCRELVGRAGELARLSARARHPERQSALLLVRAEAGVGKTRLVREFAERARESGARTVATSVREFANAPYAALLEALETLGADVELAQAPHEHEPDEKLRRFAAVAASFEAAARAAGALVVVVEDLHWADAATIELLRFLAARLVAAPIVFVGTYRDDADDADPALLRALRGLERDAAETLALAPLRDDEIDTMLHIALAEIDRTLPGAVLERVRELAEGRPLFAEELLRGALERRERDAGSLVVPASLVVTVRERFATLGETDRDVLLQAAVVGRRFSAQFVMGLSGIARPLFFAALRRARDLQLIVEEDDEHGDRFAFRHALTREAIYGELLRAEARALHARVAEALAHEDPLDISAIAEHAWRAHDIEHGIGWNERAGDRARGLFAYADAARHYLRAASIAADSAQRAHLAEKCAEALYATGDVAGAVEQLAAAMDAFGSDPERNRLALRKSYLLFDQGRYDESLREALDVVERLGAEDSVMRFNAETMTAGLLTARGRAEEALTHLERADALAARDAATSIARFEGIYAYALGLVGRADEARARFAHARRAARESGDDDVLVRALNNHGNVEFGFGKIADARRLYEEGLDVARATKNLRFVAWLSQNASLAALLGGDPEATARHLAEARAIRHDVDSVRRWTLAVELRWATLVGAETEALRERASAGTSAAQRERDAPSEAALAGALALAQLRAGDEAAARAAVAAAADVLAPDLPYWIHDAVSRCGDPELRAEARAALARVAQREGALAARGVLALSEAREAARRRRRDEAVAFAESAAAAFAAAGWRLAEAFALEQAGRGADAVALFRACGAAGEVRRLAETTGTPRRRGEATLTPREREIAALIAAGRTTRAIAELLVISERTVESHVAAIYRKLGVAGRAALAQLLDETAG
jgi:DNA-binding CsgD family transcriptional regulator/tetratricopeptide (TPR) repeat protein